MTDSVVLYPSLGGRIHIGETHWKSSPVRSPVPVFILGLSFDIKMTRRQVRLSCGLLAEDYWEEKISQRVKSGPSIQIFVQKFPRLLVSNPQSEVTQS